jgi:hypothetical protein
LNDAQAEDEEEEDYEEPMTAE